MTEKKVPKHPLLPPGELPSVVGSESDEEVQMTAEEKLKRMKNLYKTSGGSKGGGREWESLTGVLAYNNRCLDRWRVGRDEDGLPPPDIVVPGENFGKYWDEEDGWINEEVHGLEQEFMKKAQQLNDDTPSIDRRVSCFVFFVACTTS